MDELATMIRLFPFNPIAASFIAVLFMLGAFKVRNSPKHSRLVAASAMMWALYAVWEIYMLAWRSPSGDHAIRIDLMLLVPLMLFMGIVGAVALWQGLKSNGSGS